MFRNYQRFPLELVPRVLIKVFQPVVTAEESAHLLMISATKEKLYVQTTELPSVPLITIWELRTDSDDLHGYLFQTGNQRVSSSAIHLLSSSPQLPKQFSLEDAQAEGEVVRLIRTEHFAAFHYSLGATLIAQRANALMARILDK